MEKVIAQSEVNGRKISLTKYQQFGHVFYVLRTPDTGYQEEQGHELQYRPYALEAYVNAVKHWSTVPEWRIDDADFTDLVGQGEWKYQLNTFN